jgi:metallo-beta-lactamase family protein
MLSLPSLRFTETAQESMSLNALAGPAVIISASGMADAGRVRHHLRHNL